MANSKATSINLVKDKEECKPKVVVQNVVQVKKQS